MALKDNLKPTSRKGVFFRKHDTRKHGAGKDRLWVLRYTIKGKTRTETFGWASEGFTELDAEQKIAEFRANAKTGNGPTSLEEERRVRQKIAEEQTAIQKEEERRNTTFGQFFEKVYFPQAKLDKAAGTWKAEDRLYRLWIKPVIGGLTFSEISIEHLNKIKENMAAGKRAEIKRHSRDKSSKAAKAQEKRNPARPMSAKSINYAMAVIRQTWNLACAVKPPLAFGSWPGSVKAFKKPKVDNQRKRFLTKNEASLLLAALKKKSKDVHDMALLSLHCGLRAGEIFNLTWDKVNLTKGELLLIDTKNGESRIAYLTDQAREMLRQRSVKCQHPRYVFVSAGGDPDNRGPYKQVPATFSRTVKELGLNEGVTDSRDKIVFHTLRHTYASWLVENGASLPIVRDLMGHKNLTMTSRYSHVSADAQRNAVAALNQAMQPKGENVIDFSERQANQ
jgi:integrase